MANMKGEQKSRIETVEKLLRKQRARRIDWQMRIVQRYRLSCRCEAEGRPLEGVVLGAQVWCARHGLQRLVEFGRFPNVGIGG